MRALLGLGTVSLNELAELADQGETRHWPCDELMGAEVRFSDADLDALISSDRSSLGHYRFMKQGKTIDPNLMGIVDQHGRLIPARIESLKRQGITVIASRIESKVSSIRKVALELQQVTASYVRVVAIASYGSVHGMPSHYDHVDVFVAQTQGRKCWNLFGAPIPGAGVPGSSLPVPREISQSVEMRCGDRLFVPAGTYHKCDPSDYSLHLAFNLKWPCVLDLLGQTGASKSTDDLNMMEPIRCFGSRRRVERIADILGPVLRQQGYTADLAAELLEWPNRCEQQFAIR